MSVRCCNSHHFEGCCDGGPGCCPDCSINPWRCSESGCPTKVRTRTKGRLLCAAHIPKRLHDEGVGL